MPYAVRKTGRGWGVQNTESGDWKSRNTSKAKAEAQIRLLRGIKESGGKWKPTGKRRKRWGTHPPKKRGRR